LPCQPSSKREHFAVVKLIGSRSATYAELVAVNDSDVSHLPDGVQRGVFVLVGVFKFHSVSLCGRLYPLPRCTTFRFRNALHLIEACDSVTHVRSIFQWLLPLLWESERGCGYPITSRLG
jgi:hypothetical protein